MQENMQQHSVAKQILTVEDNEINLKLLKDILDYHGYDTVVTDLGVAALDIARQQLPDLILLDIRLPDIAGTDVARQLKANEQTRAIPIIAVTAFAMPDDRRQILESGCDDYVSKPINLLDFLALVERYTGGSTIRNGP